MKKLLSIVLALVLCFALTAPAMATEATLSTAKEFCSLLDEIDIVYTCKGLDEDGDDCITVEMSSDVAPDYTLIYYFTSDLSDTYLRIFNIVDLSEDDLAAALLTCNELNDDYCFGRFILDTSDNSITFAMDVLHTEDTAAELMLQATLYACQLYEASYEVLAEYDIG